MIGDKLYREIVENVPICCVDLVVRFNGVRCLLALRVNEPAKGQWWFPGGRMLKGESFEEAALRLARLELNLEVEFERVVGVYNYFNAKSAFSGVSTHTVVVAVVVRPKGSSSHEQHSIELDCQHTLWYLTDQIPEDCHEHVRAVLLDSGVLR